MRSTTVAAPGLALALTLASALPALAGGWHANGAGAAATRAGQATVTADGVVRTKCQGSNHTLTVNFSVPSATPGTATVTVFRGTAPGNETQLATTTASAGSYVDNAANTTSNNVYRLKIAVGTHWLSAFSNEVSTSSC